MKILKWLKQLFCEHDYVSLNYRKEIVYYNNFRYGGRGEYNWICSKCYCEKNLKDNNDNYKQKLAQRRKRALLNKTNCNKQLEPGTLSLTECKSGQLSKIN